MTIENKNIVITFFAFIFINQQVTLANEDYQDFIKYNELITEDQVIPHFMDSISTNAYLLDNDYEIVPQSGHLTIPDSTAMITSFSIVTPMANPAKASFILLVNSSILHLLTNPDLGRNYFASDFTADFTFGAIGFLFGFTNGSLMTNNSRVIGVEVFKRSIALLMANNPIFIGVLALGSAATGFLVLMIYITFTKIE